LLKSAELKASLTGYKILTLAADTLAAHWSRLLNLLHLVRWLSQIQCYQLTLLPRVQDMEEQECTLALAIAVQVAVVHKCANLAVTTPPHVKTTLE
jgi:hypothetical protein